MRALWYFHPLLQAQRSRLWMTLLLSVVTVAAGVALLGIAGWFLTAAALTTAALAFNLFGPSSLVRGMSLIRILARYGEKLTGHDMTLRLLSDIRAWLFGSLFPRLPLADRSLRHGDLVSRMTADVDALDTAFLVAIGPIWTAAVVGTAMSVLLFVLVPLAGAIYAAAFAAALILVPAGLILAGRRSGRKSVEASADLRMTALDGIDGHADMILFDATDRQQHQFAQQSLRLFQARRWQAVATSIGAGSVQAMAAVATVGVLWAGLEAYRAGGVGGPVLVGLLLGCLASFEALNTIVRSAGRLGAAAAAAERLVGVATSTPAILEPPVPVELAGGDLTMTRVAYAHRPGKPVLNGVEFCLRPGERVAVVGASGSGKSTLLDLILRLRDPQQGQITIGGVDLRQVRTADLHRHIALLAQDAPVFLGTVRDNLLIGRPDAEDSELWEALEKARLAGFVRALAQGLDTWLGEAGKTLSAGQARRLCLARTLLAPARILLFDEPTSGLDGATEQAFLQDLAAATEGRTVLLVTHARLPEGAVDQVWRMEGGCLLPQRTGRPATADKERRSTIST